MMKRSLAILVALLGVGVGVAESGDAAKNPAFERLKTLEGTWTGSAAHDGGGQASGGDVTVVYKVTAAGSAVQETLFPGTPHEMVTMYHLDGARLVLTHYCAAGNQPRMELEASADPNVLSFTFVGGTNMSETDMHMHSARITFVDADHVRSVWGSMKDRKPAGTATFELGRKK
jgi:hypothetical protein